MKPSEIQNQDRRHDLDALRAFAMFLGISLHASLSLFTAPSSSSSNTDIVWPVHDISQHQIFLIFMVFIHSFRMPMFFILSGFFTMMLYRKRGIKALLWQRTLHILLPCLIGCFTIVPLVNYISEKASQANSISVNLEEKSLAAIPPLPPMLKLKSN